LLALCLFGLTNLWRNCISFTVTDPKTISFIEICSFLRIWFCLSWLEGFFGYKIMVFLQYFIFRVLFFVLCIVFVLYFILLSFIHILLVNPLMDIILVGFFIVISFLQSEIRLYLWKIHGSFFSAEWNSAYLWKIHGSFFFAEWNSAYWLKIHGSFFSAEWNSFWSGKKSWFLFFCRVKFVLFRMNSAK